METLRLVDVTDEGHLVLMSGDGRRFELPVDAEVRSAVRRDRAAPPPPRGDRPGPREVQARIRAGADAESVADATGLDLSYVQRFEGPALAERRHVADLARLSQVHRDPGARQVTLEAAVLAALADSGIDGRALAWDSRRVEGSRWDVVVLVPASAGRGEGALEATWRFDVASRSLEEMDEAARRLTRLEQRKLAPVRDRVFDIDAGRAATVKARRAAAAASPQTSSTAALLEALAQQRGRRPQSAISRTAPDRPDIDDVAGGGDPGPDGDHGVTPVPIGSAGGRLHRQSAAGSSARTHGDHPAGRGRGPVQSATVDPRIMPTPGAVRTATDPMRSADQSVGQAGDHPGGDEVDGSPGRSGQDRAGRSGIGAADRAASIDSDSRASSNPGVEPDPAGRRPPGARRPPAARSSRSGSRAPVPPPESATARASAEVKASGVPAPTVPGRAPDRSGPAGASQLALEPGLGEADAAPPARTGRKRRSGVPSWDDIVFGARPDGEE